MNSAFYQIFIRNYTEEGTFRAAIKKLNEVKDLGFDWIYLCPFHPAGEKGRKGSVGSPYAIKDYRSIDPQLGTLEDLHEFRLEAERLGLRLMMDIVFNHTSPDSRLASEHPHWFIQDAQGNPGRKCAEWSDVIDFNHEAERTRQEIWDELIDTIEYWREQGFEGFRCDVASLVPKAFWVQARERINKVDKKSGNEQRPTLWLAESVHSHFLLEMRKQGFKAWSEPELHEAFDLSYDYDGWERLEQVWAGTKNLDYYLDYLYAQKTLYPQKARKIRFLENHDQMRAASRFGTGKRLEAWTAFYQFLPGSTFCYMGQEYALDHCPSLFEKDPIDWNSGSRHFRSFFKRSFSLTQAIKKEAENFSWHMLADGVVLLKREGPDSSYALICNLDDRIGRIPLDFEISGQDMLSGQRFHLQDSMELSSGALFLRQK